MDGDSYTAKEYERAWARAMKRKMEDGTMPFTAQDVTDELEKDRIGAAVPVLYNHLAGGGDVTDKFYVAKANKGINVRVLIPENKVMEWLNETIPDGHAIRYPEAYDLFQSRIAAYRRGE